MSQKAKTDAGLALGWAAFAGGTLVATFWIVYFTKAVELGQNDGLLSSFESAFPIADALFCLILFAASFCLLKRTAFGPFFLVIGASMSLYLGILDVTFYARQGLYNPLTASGAIGLAINAVCIGGGVFGLWFGWALWRDGPRHSGLPPMFSPIAERALHSHCFTGRDRSAAGLGHVLGEQGRRFKPPRSPGQS